MRKFSCLVAVIMVMVSFLGCETISTMKSGDLKMRDVKEIVSSGFTQAEKETDGKSSIAKADHWIKENLW